MNEETREKLQRASIKWYKEQTVKLKKDCKVLEEKIKELKKCQS